MIRLPQGSPRLPLAFRVNGRELVIPPPQEKAES
jgi:hypothetical protein